MIHTTEKSVIIVDDSIYIREKIKELVDSLQGCKVVAEANNGTEAIEVITKIKSDFVILDLHMPIMTGFQVLENIKEYIEDICVIVFSNYTGYAYEVKCLDLGAKYCLDKTRDLERLKDILLA